MLSKFKDLIFMSLNKTISIKYKKSNSTYHKLNFSFYLLIKPILFLSLSIYLARFNNGFNVFAQDVKQSNTYDKSDRDLFKKSPKKVTKKLINPGFKTQSSIMLSGFNDINDLINNPKRKVAIANAPTHWTTEILEKTESILKVHHPEITNKKISK